MAIKGIIFDLDGVLVDADKLHFDALNRALTINDFSSISWPEHLTIYKGIPTLKKLEILTERKGLPREAYKIIAETKQQVTKALVYNSCLPDLEKIEMIKLLKKKYKIYVCSNAIKDTVDLMLSRSALNYYIDGALSNEDVQNPKPNPEIYLKTFELAKVDPTECVIIEDSDVGYKAAIESGAFVCKVNGPEEVNYYRVLKTIREAERVNVVIPAAGQGKRFAEVGYQHPKPLIDVAGSPMIEWVLDNFKDIGRKIVLMQKQHLDKYCVQDILKYNDSTIEILPVEGLTLGAACSVLLAKDLINNNNELIVANSDQYLDYEYDLVERFLSRIRTLNMDAGLLTFESDNPKWSYAKCDDNGIVSEVREKQVISNHATVGIYYYKKGKEFVRYAEQMISKDIRTNNEFYVCPIFNEYIADGKKVWAYKIGPNCMKGLGTPEDLQLFVQRFK